MISFDDMKDLYVNAPQRNALMDFDDFMELYRQRLDKNPRAYEEISSLFIIPKLIFFANGNEAVHRANIDWLDSLGDLNAVMSDAAFGQTIVGRWNIAALAMMKDARYSRWKSDIAEVQAILSCGWSFYEMLRPLLAAVDNVDNELRERFVAVLTEMRDAERFRLFYIELDKYLEWIGKEGMKPAHKADAIRRDARDIEQSWRKWQENSYEKFVAFVLTDFVDKNLPDLGVIMGQDIERAVTDKSLGVIKRRLLIDFGIHGLFLPDADVIVYSKSDMSIIAIADCKTSLREHIAQTGFWKLKLLQNPLTSHIKVFFATSDDDDDFAQGSSTNKRKAIAMYELDAVYVLRPGLIEEHNVKVLGRIIEDLRQ